jgi:hypothetical protein
LSQPTEDQDEQKPIPSNQQDVNAIPIAVPRGKERHRHHRPHFHPSEDEQFIPSPPPPPPRPITVEELEELMTDNDDYYTNPLVSHTVLEPDGLGIDELDRMIAQVTAYLVPQQQQQQHSFATTATTSSPLLQGISPSLLRPDVSSQQNSTFPSDPYSVPGKVVKNARIYVESVDIPANTFWSGSIDFLEEGRLIAFSITCNDPDMTPTVFIENASGTQDMINDMSFKQAVQHGRGMTLSEATSTFVNAGVITSRDVSGTPSAVFPYVKRYKDQLGGDGVYDDVKNTEDDKSYVMNFEPTTSIPYQRIVFKVFNGSSLGTRMINRLEIKRLVYVDPDPIVTSNIIPSDMTQLTAALNVLAGNISHGPVLPQHSVTPPTTVRSNLATASTSQPPTNLFEDYIRYAYKRLNEPNTTKMNFVETVPVKEQEQISELVALSDNKPRKKITDDNGSAMHILFD